MTRDPRSSWFTSSIEFLLAGLYLTQPGTSIIGDPIDKVTGGVWGIDGGGGGKNTLATAGGKKIEGLNEALTKSKEISLRLIYIYSVLTALCALSYKILGMNIFDSLTHSMTTIATGGFSNYNDSIGFFNSISIEISAMIFIILGSLPFIAYIKFLSGNNKILISDVQIKTFIKSWYSSNIN